MRFQLFIHIPYAVWNLPGFYMIVFQDFINGVFSHSAVIIQCIKNPLPHNRTCNIYERIGKNIVVILFSAFYLFIKPSHVFTFSFI